MLKFQFPAAKNVTMLGDRVFLFVCLFVFIFGCAQSLLLFMAFVQLQRVGPSLPCGAWTSHCDGFSGCGAQALVAWASEVAAYGLSSCSLQVLKSRLSSCGTWTQSPCNMWNLPRPGIEPLFPALAGKFLSTMPPGKSGKQSLKTKLSLNKVGSVVPTPI